MCVKICLHAALLSSFENAGDVRPRNRPQFMGAQGPLTLPVGCSRALHTERLLHFEISIIYTAKLVFDRILEVLIGFW